LVDRIKTDNINFFSFTVSDFLSSQIVKPIKATVLIYIQNLGNGSADTRIFNSEDAAKKYAA
jgi:hypothetical protein